MVYSSEFRFSSQEKEIIEYHWSWIIRNSLPFVVVSGDSSVSTNKIRAVANVLQNFINNAIFSSGETKIKLKMQVQVDLSAGTENDTLIQQAYQKLNVSNTNYFEEAIRQYFICLLALENHKNNIKPHLDIVITKKSLGDGWGVTYPNAIILTDNKINEKLVIHEFCHAIGVDQNGDDAGNCANPNCLMNYSLPTSRICQDCIIQIMTHLITENRRRSGQNMITEL